jgi:START domain
MQLSRESRHARKIVGVVFVLIWVVDGLGQDNCVLKKDKDGIRVYSCKSTTSEFNTVKAEFMMNATLDQYFSVALDVDGFKDWHYREINPRILKKVSDREVIYYTQIDSPFPVSDRDMILRLRVSQDVHTKIVTATVESLPDYLPENGKLVRVTKSFSTLTITPISGRKLKAVYFLEADPGGKIPVWLVNAFSAQAPYETFKRFIRRVETRQIDDE